MRDVFAESVSVLMINGGGGGKLRLRSRNGGSYVTDEHLVLMAVPLRAIDILRSGRIPAISIAVHDDAAGTIFEKRPICTFNAAAIPDEPPAIEDVEALRLGGFEPKKPTRARRNFDSLLKYYALLLLCQCLCGEQAIILSIFNQADG